MRTRADTIKEIVGLYWLAGIPFEELIAKLSSHAMRKAVCQQYQRLMEMEKNNDGIFPAGG